MRRDADAVVLMASGAIYAPDGEAVAEEEWLFELHRSTAQQRSSASSDRKRPWLEARACNLAPRVATRRTPLQLVLLVATEVWPVCAAALGSLTSLRAAGRWRALGKQEARWCASIHRQTPTRTDTSPTDTSPYMTFHRRSTGASHEPSVAQGERRTAAQNNQLSAAAEYVSEAMKGRGCSVAQ